MKRGNAKLRVCASCRWIFINNKETDLQGCPKCGFGHYGAWWAYRNAAYRYKKTQKPWLENKVSEYTFKLLEEIEDSQK